MAIIAQINSWTFNPATRISPACSGVLAVYLVTALFTPPPQYNVAGRYNGINNAKGAVRHGAEQSTGNRMN